MPEEIITRETLADGSVACYRFFSTGSEAAETWLKEMNRLFSSPDDERPHLFLIDIRPAKNLVSADMFKTLRTAAAEHPNLSGKTAILFTPETSTKMVELMAQHNPMESANRPLKIFSDEKEAIAWLLGS